MFISSLIKFALYKEKCSESKGITSLPDFIILFIKYLPPVISNSLLAIAKIVLFLFNKKLKNKLTGNHNLKNKPNHNDYLKYFE